MNQDAIMGGAGAASIGLLLGCMLGLWLWGQPMRVEATQAPAHAKTTQQVEREHWNEITIPPVTITAKRARSVATSGAKPARWVCEPPRALSSGATQATPHIEGDMPAVNFDPLHVDTAAGNVTECRWVKS